MVEFRGVTKRFGDFTAVNEVNLEIRKGEFMTFLGPSGCGKTTMLRMISGFETATTGRVLLAGQDVTHVPPYKRDVNQVFQSYAIFPHLSVAENVGFWAKLHGTDMLLPAALKFFDLEQFRDIPASQLSAGWQRRVALARLIVAPCRLWLLDEPTNFLDDDAVILMASLIESRVKQGGIVVIASHIMNSAIASHTLTLGDYKP